MALTYQRTKHPTDDQVNAIDQHIADLVVQLNQQLAANASAAAVSGQTAYGVVPIGTVVFVDLTATGVPVPGPNFQKCDGSAIVDPRSPMKGTNTRDLITAGRFVRAGATSGVVQAADAVVPNHAHSLNSHTHLATGLQGGATGNIQTPAHQHAINNVTSSGTFAGTTISNPGTGGTNFFTQASNVLNNTGATSGPSVASTPSDGGSGAETRPVNMSMVPYVRIW